VFCGLFCGDEVYAVHACVFFWAYFRFENSPANLICTINNRSLRISFVISDKPAPYLPLLFSTFPLPAQSRNTPLPPLIQTRRSRCRRSNSPRLFLRRSSAAPTHQHTPHHIEQRVTLTRDLDPKIHFPNLVKGLVPTAARRIREIRLILTLQHAEQFRTPALHG